MSQMYNFVDVELPTKLSDLINLALDDLIKCEEMSDKYKVDMAYYCDNSNSGKCFVCFAGAVMAQTLKCDGDHLTTEYLITESKYSNVIDALDDVRCGCVNYALAQLGIVSDKEYDTYIVRYRNDPEEFKKQMRALSATLATDGL